MTSESKTVRSVLRAVATQPLDWDRVCYHYLCSECDRKVDCTHRFDEARDELIEAGLVRLQTTQSLARINELLESRPAAGPSRPVHQIDFFDLTELGARRYAELEEAARGWEPGHFAFLEDRHRIGDLGIEPGFGTAVSEGVWSAIGTNRRSCLSMIERQASPRTGRQLIDHPSGVRSRIEFELLEQSIAEEDIGAWRDYWWRAPRECVRVRATCRWIATESS